MGLEYDKGHQCTVCGLTRQTKTLKLARRIDDVMKIDELVWVCADEKVCARMKGEREILLTREKENFKTKPFGKGGRPKKPKPLEPLKLPSPVKRSKKTLQVFPLNDSPAALRARQRAAKKKTGLDWGDPLNGREEDTRAKVPKE